VRKAQSSVAKVLGQAFTNGQETLTKDVHHIRILYRGYCRNSVFYPVYDTYRSSLFSLISVANAEAREKPRCVWTAVRSPSVWV